MRWRPLTRPWPKSWAPRLTDPGSLFLPAPGVVKAADGQPCSSPSRIGRRGSGHIGGRRPNRRHRDEHNATPARSTKGHRKAGSIGTCKCLEPDALVSGGRDVRPPSRPRRRPTSPLHLHRLRSSRSALQRRGSCSGQTFAASACRSAWGATAGRLSWLC